jgi:CTP synthase
MVLHQAQLSERVCEKLHITTPPPNLAAWEHVLHAYRNPRHAVKVAVVGKYIDLEDAYKSINESLIHAGIQTETRVEIIYFDAESLEQYDSDLLEGMDAILVPGGFGNRGIEGKIKAVQYAREHQIPFLGICLGLQVAVIEFARHVMQLPEANSTEFVPNTKDPVISLVSQWNKSSDLGGTMRLGEQPCHLKAGSLAQRIYNASLINERHRHRFEVNNQYVSALEAAGLTISGRSPLSNDDQLVEMIELSNHPWFVACQFHPEFTSTPRQGHPLFIQFIQAALKRIVTT